MVWYELSFISQLLISDLSKIYTAFIILCFLFAVTFYSIECITSIKTLYSFNVSYSHLFLVGYSCEQFIKTNLLTLATDVPASTLIMSLHLP